MQKGYYRDDGIDLTLLRIPARVTPEQLRLHGSRPSSGSASPRAVTSAAPSGEPMVSIAAIIQHNTSALVTLKSSGLDTVAKLAGKRYAGFGAPYEKPVIEQVLSCGGAAAPASRTSPPISTPSRR